MKISLDLLFSLDPHTIILMKFAISPSVFVQDEASFDASIKALLGLSAYIFDSKSVNLAAHQVLLL